MYKPYNSRILNDEIICAYSQPHLIEETPEQQKHRQYILNDFQEDLKVALLKSGIVQPNINIDTLILTMGHYAQIQAYTKTLAMHYEQAFRQVWQRYFEGIMHSFKFIYNFDTDTFKPLITPFYPHLVKRTLGDVGNIDIVSFGTSSYGYDARLHEEVYTFTNSNGGVLDPKNFDRSLMVKPKVFDSDNGRYVLIPPNGFLLGRSMEFFNIPRNVNATCIGKSTYARCFTGNTKVALANGTSLTFLEMIDRSEKGEKFYGYGIDIKGDVVMTELTAPRLIGKDEVIYSVLLDNNETVDCTGDHKFILKDGTEIEAQNLIPGTSLMPLYRVISRGYEAVIQPVTPRFTSTHYLADKWNIEHGVYEYMENSHRHHKDENKLNNYPYNVTRINGGEHIRMHNLQRSKDPVFLANLSSSMKKAFKINSSDPQWMAEFKDKCVKAARSFWDDDKHIETRELHYAKRKIFWENATEEYKDAYRQRAINILNSEKVRARQREGAALRWADKEQVDKQRELMRNVRLRKDITEEKLRESLSKTGSIRETARILGCDRTTFKRFKNVILEFKTLWENKKITTEQIVEALRVSSTVREAATLLGVSKSFIHKRKEALSQFFQAPVAENHKVVSVVKTNRKEDVYCLTSLDTGNFALEAGVFVNNCGLVVNVTPLEAEWSGTVTLEISNTTPLPAKVYLEEGICQFLFTESSEPCKTSYSDRKGKYMNQVDVTMSKV